MRFPHQLSAVLLLTIGHAAFAMAAAVPPPKPVEAGESSAMDAAKPAQMRAASAIQAPEIPTTQTPDDPAMQNADDLAESAPGRLAGLPGADRAAEAPRMEGAPHQPFELARSLYALQNQIAIGSEAAFAAQHALLTRLGREMLEADPKLWAEPKNARAAITFVLSGGQPKLLRVLLKNGSLPDAMADIARGALAYATGRRVAALALLGDVDALTLAPSAGAHLALAQGTMTMKADPQRAIGYLEIARLLAPGTLVEESALRRQIRVASAMADAARFTFLMRQYIRRFPHSIYAASFLRGFPDLWANLALSGGGNPPARLERTLSGLDGPVRRRVYLALARHMLLAGNRDLARFAAIHAAAGAESGGATDRRARFYMAAAGITGPDAAVATQALREIDPALLSTADARLHAAVLAVAKEVAVPLTPATAGADPAGVSEATAIVARARAAVSAANALLATSKW